MKVTVQSVRIPGMSTLGYGVGTNEAGDTVHFAGDHRPMRALALAMDADHIDVPMEVDLEGWQIIAILPKGLDPEELRGANDPIYITEEGQDEPALD